MVPHEHRGVIHLHSHYSDGSATVEQIIHTAQKVGLDFVMLSDHNSLEAQEQGYEGWHGDTLLLVGNEISPCTHHYLAFGVDEPLNGRDYADPTGFVTEVSDRGGLGIIAHPFGGRSRYFRIKPASWTRWDTDRYDGIEIWSYMVDWAEQVAPWSLFYYYRHPERAIRGPHPDTLRMWDTVSQQRRVIGIGSIDAHGKPLPLFPPIKFLPYEHLFRTIRTHILTDGPLSGGLETARWQVYEAIRRGHCFIAYDALADASGFRMHADEGEWLMGEEHLFQSPVNLTVALPQPAQFRLIRNGELMMEERGKRFEYPIMGPGVYRTEVFLSGMPWILSNPLFLRAES